MCLYIHLHIPTYIPIIHLHIHLSYTPVSYTYIYLHIYLSYTLSQAHPDDDDLYPAGLLNGFDWFRSDTNIHRLMKVSIFLYIY